MNMAYSLSRELDPLLRPNQLLSVADIIADRTLVPDVGGIYGWWFDIDLPGEDATDALSHDRSRLRYIGIAPRAPFNGRPSKSTLRRRILRNHLGSRLASSTLRRTLAKQLRGELGLQVSKRTVGSSAKAFMSPADELRLTDWLRRHACVSILVTDAPWEIEAQLLRSGDLECLLNKAGV